MSIKLYIGPMSKNIVDATISFGNSTGNRVAFIPSRRQIDYNRGYVNNWNTKTFAEYVRSKSSTTILQRDHGGPEQGDLSDDGFASLKIDCENFDLIHIDPWKKHHDFETGCILTADYIRFCYKINPNIRYEIGTEQSIFPYSSFQLNSLILYLKKHLSDEEYNNIIFSVIQSGTSLKENINTGKYDQSKLIKMVEICKNHGLLSKEHNGDYLPTSLIHEKFDHGLDAINIAPEFGQIETQTYIKEISDQKVLDTYFDLCYHSNKWKKWVDKDFNPHTNKEKTINICGHYILSDKKFLTEIKSNVRPDIDNVIQSNITTALKKLYGIIC